MSALNNDSIAKKALADLDANVLSKVNENVQIVTDFTQKLQHEIQNVGQSYAPFHGASIMHCGSAYEGLAVKVKADFDVLLVLGKPYIAENFIVRRDPSGYFNLRWNSPAGPIGSYLNAGGLQQELFGKIKGCVRRVSLPNAVISKCEPGLAAMQITIARGTNRISIDLAPQIVCHTWNHCPDIIPLRELPITLRQHIEHLERNSSPIFYFTPAVPDSYSNRFWLCGVAFSQLEKKFVVSCEIRDVVRLAKLVAHRRGWGGNYHLKSFHLKRVALKYYSRLQNLNLWDGYRVLLSLLSDELNRGIDGYFIRNQTIWLGQDGRNKTIWLGQDGRNNTIWLGHDGKQSALQREIAEVLGMNAVTLFGQQ